MLCRDVISVGGRWPKVLEPHDMGTDIWYPKVPRAPIGPLGTVPNVWRGNKLISKPIVGACACTPLPPWLNPNFWFCWLNFRLELLVMAIEFQLHLPFQTMTTQIPIYQKKTASEPLLGLLRILYALLSGKMANHQEGISSWFLNFDWWFGAPIGPTLQIVIMEAHLFQKLLWSNPPNITPLGFHPQRYQWFGDAGVATSG